MEFPNISVRGVRVDWFSFVECQSNYDLRDFVRRTFSWTIVDEFLAQLCTMSNRLGQWWRLFGPLDGTELIAGPLDEQSYWKYQFHNRGAPLHHRRVRAFVPRQPHLPLPAGPTHAPRWCYPLIECHAMQMQLAGCWLSLDRCTRRLAWPLTTSWMALGVFGPEPFRMLKKILRLARFHLQFDWVSAGHLL